MSDRTPGSPARQGPTGAASQPPDFQTAIESMLDPFVIHRAVRDARGAISDFVRVYGNPALTRLDADRDLQDGAGSLDVHPSGPGYALFAGSCQVVDTGIPMLLDEFDLKRPVNPDQVERIFDLRITRHDDGIAITGRDITRYVLAEREGATRTGRLIAAIEQTAESVVIADPNAAIVYVNPAFEQTTGYASAEVIGQNPRILNSGAQAPEFYEQMWRTLRAGETWRGELVNRRKDGTAFTEDASITPVFDRSGTLSSYVAVKRDVTQLRRVESTLSATIRQRATVLNSLSRIETQETPEATAQLISESMLQLPGVDFGAIVQFTSHHASFLGVAGPSAYPLHQGDLLPDTRAAYLRGRASHGPWAGAWVPRAEDGQYAVLATASGVTGFAYSPIVDGDGLVSGLVVMGTVDPDWDTCQADLCVMVREFGITARTLLGGVLVDRARMDRSRAAIARIIATKAFSPVFQSVVDLRDGRPIGYEALTRFADGRRPDVTFAEAHLVKMGVDLELATLRSAIDAAAGLPGDAWLSINVSPRLLLAGDRLREVVGSAKRRIVIEITEHEAIDDYEAVRAALAQLGPDVQVAVDDAGAGVANFNHIVELRPDYVKIDVGLIRNVEADLARQAAVVSLLHFARASDRWAIAEGVETEAERSILERLGVPYAQGYLFNRPLPIEVIRSSQAFSSAQKVRLRVIRATPAA